MDCKVEQVRKNMSKGVWVRSILEYCLELETHPPFMDIARFNRFKLILGGITLTTLTTNV